VLGEPGLAAERYIHGHHDWPDVPATDDGAEGAGVVVARRERPYRVSVAGYLVDTSRLGVKDALDPRSMTDSDPPTFLRRFFAASGGDTGPLEVPLELARHLVWGAVEHARRLGFEPHPDLASVIGHLGPWDEIRCRWASRPTVARRAPRGTRTPSRTWCAQTPTSSGPWPGTRHWSRASRSSPEPTRT
jgi:hypothetical protein